MGLALRDLNTELYFAHGKWTGDLRLAQEFPDREAVEKIVFEHQIKNAEMVFLDGEPPRVAGGCPIPLKNKND